MTDCLSTDIFGYVWTLPCGQPIPDPCLPGGATLFYASLCGETTPTLPEWCESYPTHPVCIQNGLPGLPPTGGSAQITVTGSGILVAGVLCLLAARFRRV